MDKILDLINTQTSKHQREIEDLFKIRLSCILGYYPTKEKILLLNMNDFTKTTLDNNPEWTHYYYKNQRIVSLGPIKFEPNEFKDGNYVMKMIQQYY